MSDLLTERPLPDGFLPSASESGLLVPEEHAREREVWTRDEMRLIERFVKLMRARDVAVTLHCIDERCKGAEVEVVAEPTGGYRWQCGHKARVFYRAI